MIHKHVLPETFDFGVPSVEMIGVGSKGLDKTAMVKRASAFEDVLEKIEKKANRTYLHVITTGAFEKYGANANCDAWNGDSFDLDIPFPEDGKTASVKLDGGLSKYHDDTYMKGGAVYQEHQTKRAGVDPSGEIVCARYNPMMKRGELLIAVDTVKWAPRLQKKASGKDIYLSIGADVPRDLCFPKDTLILTDKGYRPIQEIQPDDIVHTQQGNWKSVVATCKNPAHALTRITSMGLPLPLESTPNHPIYVVRAEQLRSCHGSSTHKDVNLKRRHTFTGDSDVCTYCGHLVTLDAEYVAAEDIKVNDYLKIRIDTSSDTDTVGTAFAYLCGQYLGDGSPVYAVTGHNKTGVTGLAGISISASAAAQDYDILQRVQESFTAVSGKKASVTPDNKGRCAYVVDCRDKLLASRILSNCGKGSHNKCINKDILNWSKNEKLALLAGLIDSDGCIDSTGKQGIRISTVNRGLALSILRICWSIGIRATCYLGNSRESRLQQKWATEDCAPAYCIGIREYPSDICMYSAKVARYPEIKSTMSGATVILHKGFAYVRVTGVTTFESDEIEVYNFEVEDDNTYTAEGIDVHNCVICGRSAKTASQHCDHFKKHRGQVFDCGKVACVMNDSPSFYDISGVDVPADRIAFVLQKVASGATQKEASIQAISELGCRKSMLLTKAAAILRKLSNMEKQVQGLIEGDKHIDLEAFTDSDEAKKDFILKVENYPSDEVIDSCNRKGILLSPEMLFKILSTDCEDENDRSILSSCSDDDCGDMSCMMQELEEDEDQNTELMDGSFDQHLPADLNLDRILETFLPEFGTSNPVIQTKVIKITITGRQKDKGQKKEASLNKFAQDALRRTYARYVISFAEQNDDAACMNALMKIAAYGK